MTWIVDAHGYGKRFIVRADEKLTAFWNSKQGFAQLRRYRYEIEVSNTICAA